MADASKTFDLFIRTRAELTAIQNSRKELEAVRDEMQAAGIDTAALDGEIAELNKSYGQKHTEAYTEHLREQIAATKQAGKDASVLEERLKGLESATKKAGDGAAGFSGIFKGAFAANLASGAVMKARMEIEQLGQRAMDLAGRLDDLSTKSGQSAETLQLIGNAASQDGVAFESVAEALNNLQRAQSSAVDGNTKLEKSFVDLGVNQTELAGMKPDELFLRLSDGVATAGDRGKALNDVLAILGRNGRAVFGTMEKGSKDISELSKSMGIMSGTSVAALAGAKEQIERISNAVTVFAGKQITAAMIVGQERLNKGLKGNIDLITQLFLPMIPTSTKLVLEFAAAQEKAGKALDALGKKPAPAGGLTDFIDRIREANGQMATLVELTERLSAAQADQEQQRIQGLVKAGLISPEEGARQKEEADIKAERERLLRQRDAEQRAIMRDAGRRQQLEDMRKMPGADSETIDHEIKQIDDSTGGRKGNIAESNIRLETNRDRQAAFERQKALEQQEAERKRREDWEAKYGAPRLPSAAERGPRPLRSDRIIDETGDRTKEMEQEAKRALDGKTQEVTRLSATMGAIVEQLISQRQIIAEANQKAEAALQQGKNGRA